MTVRRFQREDLQWLRQQPGHEHLRQISDDEINRMADSLDCFSVIAKDGRVLLIGGFTAYWTGRYEAWATLNKNCRREFVGINRVVKAHLKKCRYRRVEASVEVDFEMGHRWVKALGFKLEAKRLRAFSPNGADCSLYARVSNG
jgi:hypothetical protein